MKSVRILFISLIFSIHGYSQVPAFRKLTNDERLAYVKQGKFPDERTVFIDTLGNPSSKDLLWDPAFWADYYVDESGNVVQAVVRRSTVADKLLYSSIIDFVDDRNGKITSVDINCNEIRKILEQSYKVDQELRSSGDVSDPVR